MRWLISVFLISKIADRVLHTMNMFKSANLRVTYAKNDLLTLLSLSSYTASVVISQFRPKDGLSKGAQQLFSISTCCICPTWKHLSLTQCFLYRVHIQTPEFREGTLGTYSLYTIVPCLLSRWSAPPPLPPRKNKQLLHLLGETALAEFHPQSSNGCFLVFIPSWG